MISTSVRLLELSAASSFSSVRGTWAKGIRSVRSVQFIQFSLRTLPALALTIKSGLRELKSCATLLLGIPMR